MYFWPHLFEELLVDCDKLNYRFSWNHYKVRKLANASRIYAVVILKKYVYSLRNFKLIKSHLSKDKLNSWSLLFDILI